MSRAKRPHPHFEQPHQAAAMHVMDGYPRWVLTRAIRGLLYLLVGLPVLGLVALKLGLVAELASVIVVAGGLTAAIGMLPMVAMLAIFWAPPPQLLRLTTPALSVFASAPPVAPGAWPAAGLERPPRTALVA